MGRVRELWQRAPSPFGRGSERKIASIPLSGRAAVRTARTRLLAYGRSMTHFLRAVRIPSARENGEHRLETLEARTRAMFDSSPLAMFMADATGTITSSNRKLLELVHAAEDTPFERQWLGLVHSEDHARVLTERRALLRGERHSIEITYRLASISRGVRTVHERVTAVYADGRRLGFSGVLEDISERLRLEENLRQAQKMELVGQFAGGIAHDFNNLLTVIMNGISMLESAQAHTQRALLEQVEQAAERAAALTGQLLAFGRRQAVQRRPVDLNELVSNIGQMLRRVIGEHLEFDAQLSPDEAPALVDPNMIEQVLMNLVVNARDATPQGGTISLALENVVLGAGQRTGSPTAASLPPDGEYVRISVRDTGTGIKAEHLPHVFEPFFTTKEPGRGTGLGLANVYAIVKQHEGWVDVESELGSGTAFHIYLPRSAQQPTRRVSQPVRLKHGGNETILLVEDEVAVRDIVRASLELSGYRVLAASDASLAERLWRRHKRGIDMLITDLIMPGPLSGEQLAQRLRAEKPALRVLYMSGYGEQQLPEQPQGRFLQKPFQPETLTRAVRETLDSGTRRARGGGPAEPASGSR